MHIQPFILESMAKTSYRIRTISWLIWIKRVFSYDPMLFPFSLIAWIYGSFIGQPYNITFTFYFYYIVLFLTQNNFSVYLVLLPKLFCTNVYQHEILATNTYVFDWMTLLAYVCFWIWIKCNHYFMQLATVSTSRPSDLDWTISI
jgi:hypothetical protein